MTAATPLKKWDWEGVWFLNSGKWRFCGLRSKFEMKITKGGDIGGSRDALGFWIFFFCY
ncbi:uncharacterized protein DS421_2g37700 [Arachis hypogaea]|nr:uncharacterized protein DS421_2g37700 [Arachis hypogaea]